MYKYVSVVLIAMLLSSAAITQLSAQSEEGEGQAAICQEQMTALAAILNMEEAAIREAMADGQSLADLAAEQGMTAAEVAQALTDNLIACETDRIATIAPEMLCNFIEGPQRPLRMAQLGDNQWDRIAARILQTTPDGTSWAEVAEAQGMSADELINEMVNFISQQIYNQVNSNRLSQEQANEVLETLEADVTEFVNAAPPRPLLEVAQDIIGLSGADFYQPLIEGQTLAELAEANGVSVDDLTAALTEAASLQLENVPGISDCAKEVRLNTLSNRIADYINQPNPPSNLLAGRPGIIIGERDEIATIPGLPEFRNRGDGFTLPMLPGLPNDLQGLFENRGEEWTFPNLPEDMSEELERQFGERGGRFALPMIPGLPEDLREEFEGRFGEGGRFEFHFEGPGGLHFGPDIDCENLPEIEITIIGPDGEPQEINPAEFFECEDPI